MENNKEKQEEEEEKDHSNSNESNNNNNENNENICYSCKGLKIRLKKIKNNENKWIKIEKECKACSGKGIIIRTKRRNNNNIENIENIENKWIKKNIRKSYPSFIAPGPFPLGIRNNNNNNQDNNHLNEREDEELCYLVGNWKIYQKLSRHRYSTDDLVTTWYAHKECSKLGHIKPTILDIGCGLGSVLMSNSWQFPQSKCLGIEAQYDRYEQALRSIEYNIGIYGIDQDRIHIINYDIRDVDSILYQSYSNGFQLITGTPPYFAPHLPGKPGCIETAGCLFEMRGGVEVYCHVASKHLQQPPTNINNNNNNNNNDIEIILPSLFTLCNTSLASSRVYQAAFNEKLVILKRVDVIPRENKPPLFCVFIMTSFNWIIHYSNLFSSFIHQLNQFQYFQNIPSSNLDSNNNINNNFDISEESLLFHMDHSFKFLNWNGNEMRVETGKSVYGEEVEVICVRDKHGQHTLEYQQIMKDLGKPSSIDREIYDVNNQLNNDNNSNSNNNNNSLSDSFSNININSNSDSNSDHISNNLLKI